MAHSALKSCLMLSCPKYQNQFPLNYVFSFFFPFVLLHTFPVVDWDCLYQFRLWTATCEFKGCSGGIASK